MPNRAVINGVVINGEIAPPEPTTIDTHNIGEPEVHGAELNFYEVNGGLESFAVFEGVVVEFEQIVGVTFDGVVVDFLQSVQLRSTAGGSGEVAVEFAQQVIRTFSGNVIEFAQLVVDD
jgi:hypothetical protein